MAADVSPFSLVAPPGRAEAESLPTASLMWNCLGGAI
jgi:hypothetical protein